MCYIGGHVCKAHNIMVYIIHLMDHERRGKSLLKHKTTNIIVTILMNMQAQNAYIYTGSIGTDMHSHDRCGT